MSIRVENLTSLYNKGTAMESCALKDISFEIENGTFLAIIGATGSGKTTLVQHLDGLMRPDEGSVYVNGEDIFSKGYNLRDLRFKVGLVFQYPEYQLFEEDVISDVMFGPKNKGLSLDEARTAARLALKQSGINEELFNRSPFDLSGGQKKRVAIAGVLAMNPEVLILDEPTSGLDPEGRDEILSMLKRLKEERNITVILVSHNMEDVALCADMVLVLSKGELKFFDKPKEVFKHISELESYGLAAPEITYLAHDLYDEGLSDIDLSISTVKEAREEITNLLKKRNMYVKLDGKPLNEGKYM